MMSSTLKEAKNLHLDHGSKGRTFGPLSTCWSHSKSKYLKPLGIINFMIDFYTVSPLIYIEWAPNVKFGAHSFLPYIGFYVNSIKGNYLFILYKELKYNV